MIPVFLSFWVMGEYKDGNMTIENPWKSYSGKKLVMHDFEDFYVLSSYKNCKVDFKNKSKGVKK